MAPTVINLQLWFNISFWNSKFKQMFHWIKNESSNIFTVLKQEIISICIHQMLKNTRNTHRHPHSFGSCWSQCNANKQFRVSDVILTWEMMSCLAACCLCLRRMSPAKTSPGWSIMFRILASDWSRSTHSAPRPSPWRTLTAASQSQQKSSKRILFFSKIFFSDIFSSSP